MCTVTVISLGGEARVAANRDELRSRPEAMPPEIRPFGRRWAILPVDPVAGGTWIAANDAGLAMTVLNVTVAPDLGMVVRPRLSRGTIIPALLSCEALSEAVERAGSLDARAYAPFRLVVIDRGELAELRSDGKQVRLVSREGLRLPRLFTSSGLGDGLVQGPRNELFMRQFTAAKDRVAAQDAFHRHSWPDRPHLSVCMRRPDARTVSHTVVTLRSETIALDYHAAAPDRPARRFTRVLDQAGGARCRRSFP